jgi:hypothetical protein
MPMTTHSAAFFAEAILLVLIITAHPSLQDSGYDPSQFGDYNSLRLCVQFCVDPEVSTYNPGLIALGCSTNDCYCRADVVPQAVSAVSTCAVTSCSSDANDVASATSFYEAYCSSVTGTTTIPILTTASASSGSAMTGTAMTGTAGMLLFDLDLFLSPFLSVFA